jgi:hypothetical protein
MPRATVNSGLPGSDPIGLGVFANADLTAIHGPGVPDGNGDPAPGPLLWSGTARGYLTRTDRTVLSDGQQTRLKVDVFQLPAIAGAPILEAAGPDWTATTVTILDRRAQATPVELTFRVAAMENRVTGTILDQVRLEFERG